MKEYGSTTTTRPLRVSQMLHPRLFLTALCALLAIGTTNRVACGQDEPPLRLALAMQAKADNDTLGKLIQSRSDEMGDGVQAATFRQMLAQNEFESNDSGEVAIGGREEDEEASAESSRARSTAEQLARLRKPITQIRLQTTEEGPVPEAKASLPGSASQPVIIASLGIGPPGPNRYMQAPMHRPLYFEQRNLERCGRSCGYFQSFVSGYQFVASTMWLPYHMCDQRADCPVPAGGDCFACQDCPDDCGLLPVNHRALITEAAAVAGFSFLLL